MVKRRTKAQICGDYFDAYKAIKEGRKVKRSGTKDGSISTHPMVEVRCPYPEKDVLHDCLIWLRKYRIKCWRSNVGSGIFGESGYRTYGIIGSADITGLLPNGIRLEVECKAGKGGRLSIAQQKFAKAIRENSGVYLVCHGVEELEFLMEKYL